MPDVQNHSPSMSVAKGPGSSPSSYVTGCVFCDSPVLMKKSTAVQLVAMCWQSLPSSSSVPLCHYVFFEFLRQQIMWGEECPAASAGLGAVPMSEGFGAASCSSGGSGYGFCREIYVKGWHGWNTEEVNRPIFGKGTQLIIQPSKCLCLRAGDSNADSRVWIFHTLLMNSGPMGILARSSKSQALLRMWWCEGQSKGVLDAYWWVYPCYWGFWILADKGYLWYEIYSMTYKLLLLSAPLQWKTLM